MHIFGTDGDISNIRKNLNSAYHEEQAVEVSRKSANFCLPASKGFQKPLISIRRKAALITTYSVSVEQRDVCGVKDLFQLAKGKC